MRERLLCIIRKEFIQAFREPRMRSMLFIPPLIQLLVFGYAVNLDVDHATIAWMDRRSLLQSRELLAAFQGSGRFDMVATPANDREVQQLLDRASATGGARAARFRARHRARPHHRRAGPDRRHQLQHRVHRFQLRVFHRH